MLKHEKWGWNKLQTVSSCFSVLFQFSISMTCDGLKTLGPDWKFRPVAAAEFRFPNALGVLAHSAPLPIAGRISRGGEDWLTATGDWFMWTLTAQTNTLADPTKKPIYDGFRRWFISRRRHRQLLITTRTYNRTDALHWLHFTFKFLWLVSRFWLRIRKT